jgi:hypothetical protein
MKLVISCCIFHNWIIDHGIEEVILAEASWVPNNNGPHGHAIPVDDNVAWAAIRDECANHMWSNRGNMRI